MKMKKGHIVEVIKTKQRGVIIKKCPNQYYEVRIEGKKETFKDDELLKTENGD